MLCAKFNYFRRRLKNQRFCYNASAIIFYLIIFGILQRITQVERTPEVIPQVQIESKSEAFFGFQSDKKASKSLFHIPKSSEHHEAPVIAVLVLVCDRVSVTRTLDQIFKYKPDDDRFPVILSLDCGKRHKKVDALVHKKYGKQLTYMKHPNYQKIKNGLEPVPDHMQGYYSLAAHYGWALNSTFHMGYENVIIVEDDLDISSDFFEYFRATLQLMKLDSTIWCVSAYNDNGKPEIIDERTPEILYRSDFFPGLGWMLTKNVWNGLSEKWPPVFWDDWMRQPTQRMGRACIRPEISRSKTYGKVGTSNGQFFEEHLATIKLNTKYVPFSTLDLTYLLKSTYDDALYKRVQAANFAHSVEALADQPDSLEFKIPYRDTADFKYLARELQLMEDFKAGVPRGGYLGIVPTMYMKKRIFLVPVESPEM